MGAITTFTGRHMDPLAPDASQIELRDICHALSLLCRGGGHAKAFYSVAQHVMACTDEAAARGLSFRIQLGCLLHDASEAYMVDLPTPIKYAMPVYREAEDKLLDLIFTAFMGTPPDKDERHAIFAIDHDMTSADMHYLIGEDINTRYKNLVTMPDYAVKPFETVSRRLFERIYNLSREVKR